MSPKDFRKEVRGVREVTPVASGTMNKPQIIKSKEIDLAGITVTSPDGGRFYGQINNVVSTGEKIIGLALSGIWDTGVIFSPLEKKHIAMSSYYAITFTRGRKLIVYYI